MKTMLLVCAIFLGAMGASADSPTAPTFQELMDPALFPESQRGMLVESAQQKGQTVHIRTTGADIHIDPAGKVLFHQRIGHERPLATLDLGRRLEGVALTHSRKGFARIIIDKPKMTLRINGDSLFMLHAHEPLAAAVNRQIEVAWSSSFEANHLLADEWGAFGLYCSQLNAKDGFDALSPTVARYPLGADDVLWVGVCPPKPYDWDRSLSDNVVWHWSRQSAYPPDDALTSWSEYGNIVLLQAELMLWKDWNLAFIPRLGVEEFARVRKTIHDQNMRFIVYTSPYYFLKGTALEPRAFNTFENFKSWPPGTPTGENMGLFMPEIERVMAEYKPDGLYFDGQYIRNPAALYALARRSREVVGEDGILEWHSTMALGSQHCYLPQADAYVDFILRGEGRDSSYSDFDYLRFFVSGYNIHNSIGVICNNSAAGLTPELAKDVLRANARTHTIVSWLGKPAIMKTLKEVYQAGLTPELRQAVEADIDARQAKVTQKAEAARAERNALAAEPAWGKPVYACEFDTLPEAERVVSPTSPKAITLADGALRVSACANTYAFLRIPLAVDASGFVVKIRQGTDGGQSWGPAAMLMWPEGGGVRIGTRKEGALQGDILGSQRVGGEYDPATWIWLRARWLDIMGVVERSSDGVAYEKVWTFSHGGALQSKTAALLIGKVPYNGVPQDYAVSGPSGTCEFDSIRVYGTPAGK